MTPPTVNAYYDPQMNNVNFPAGYLQPPFFSGKEDDAANYGDMGSTIGHELTHASMTRAASSTRTETCSIGDQKRRREVQ